MHLVDIIIPTYNRRDLLMRILAALSTQTVNDFGVVIVDDGGSETINPSCYAFITHYRWTKHNDFHKNRNVNYAINNCVTAPSVIMLDDDTVPCGNEWIAGFLEPLKTFNVVRACDHPNWFSTTNTAFQTNLLIQIGGYDMNYDGRYGHSDSDLGMSIRKLGIPVGYGDARTAANHLGKDYSGDRSGMKQNAEYFKSKWGISLEEAFDFPKPK